MPEIVCLTNSRQMLKVGLPNNLPHYVLYQTVERILESHSLQDRRLFNGSSSGFYRQYNVNNNTSELHRSHSINNSNNSYSTTGLNRSYSINNSTSNNTSRGRQYVPYTHNNTSQDRYGRSFKGTGNVQQNNVQLGRRFSTTNNNQMHSVPAPVGKNPARRRITLPQTGSNKLGPRSSLEQPPMVHRKQGFHVPFDHSLTNEDRSLMTSDQSMIERSRKFGMSQEVVIQEAMKEDDNSSGLDSGVFSEICEQESKDPKPSILKNMFFQKLMKLKF